MHIQHDKNMNILTLCYEFPPLGGGGAKVVQGLSRELGCMGYHVDIVTMDFKGLSKYEKHENVNIYRIPCIRKSESVSHPHEMASYIASALPTVGRLLKQKRYELNHTHFIFPDGILAYYLKKKNGMPYVITAHGSDVPAYNPDRFKVLHKFLTPLWIQIVRSADCIICPSETLEQLIHKIKPDAVTSVIANGIDIGKFNPKIEKKDRILVVTRMLKRKGVQYVLKALKDSNHGYDVNIVGDGPYLERLRTLASGENIKVRFWGWLDNESDAIKVLFETSSIFIFPSEAENFPIVLLEAMAAGMAIITTEGTGCAEVVGDSGILVKPRDPDGIKKALSTLIMDKELKRKLGMAARERLEKQFSWSAVAKRYADIYQKYKAF